MYACIRGRIPDKLLSNRTSNNFYPLNVTDEIDEVCVLEGFRWLCLLSNPIHEAFRFLY
jgi:hypothetical protein